MKMGQYERRYLQVEADFLPDGKVIPKVLYWENEDGRVLPFSIDRILDIERAACLKAGGFENSFYWRTIAGLWRLRAIHK